MLNVIISVSGGNVKDVAVNGKANVILVDWDNIEEGDEPGVYPTCSIEEWLDGTDNLNAAKVEKLLKDK